jgi:DNA-binding transcriptional ArsR family regulator
MTGPTVEELAAQIGELSGRVDALERASRGAPQADVTPDSLSGLREAREREPGGVVFYAGVGPRGEGEVAWQLAHRWDDVLTADRARTARPLAALGHPARLDIVCELVAGPLGRQALQDRLDRATAGQLNHHLRELLAAGIVSQPRRGVYEVAVNAVVPLLTLLGCAGDLASDADAAS